MGCKLRRGEDVPAEFFGNLYFARLKSRVLRTLFESGNLSDAGHGPLLMELGNGYCLLSQLDGKPAQPRFARLWSFDAARQEHSLLQIMDTIDAAGIGRNKVRVALALPHTTLLPDAFEGKADVLLDALFPGQGSEARVYSGHQHYVFVVPRSLNALLHDKFNEVSFVPALACSPATANEGNCIEAFFIDSEVRVGVYREGKLLLQQQYGYQAPLDVVYYLLKICSAFNFNQQDSELVVSGFIAADSALFKELHQYFRDIRFVAPGTVTIDDTEIPQYYFSSIYNLAQCAL